MTLGSLISNRICLRIDDVLEGMDPGEFLPWIASYSGLASPQVDLHLIGLLGENDDSYASQGAKMAFLERGR